MFGIITPSAVNRRWLVQREVLNEETGQMEPVVETASDDKSKEIRKELIEQGFDIVDEKSVRMTREQVSRYLAINDKAEDEELAKYLLSGTSVLLKLAPSNNKTFQDLQVLLGPVDPEVAREGDLDRHGEDYSKWSVRGKFGVTGVKAGILASRDAKCAARELALFFPTQSRVWQRAVIRGGAVDASSLPHDLVIVKNEDGVTIVEGFNAFERLLLVNNDLDVEDGASEIAEIERMLLVCLDQSQTVQIERLLGKYGFTILAKSCLEAKQIITISLQENPATAFVVAKANPMGTAKVMISENGLDVYTSMEFGWLFPHLDRKPESKAKDCKTFVRKANTRGSPGSEPQLVQSLLVSGLVELCKVKPAGLDAVNFLGEWLLKNNPDRQAAERAEQWLAQRNSQIASLGRADSVGQLTKSSSLAIIGDADTSEKKRTIAFVLGAPGSGKGTQCERLAKKLNYCHITTGELLRHEVQIQSEIGKKVMEQMDAGQLVDTDIIISLLKRAIQKSHHSRFLIDGFPREIGQVELFEKQVGPCDIVLNMECPIPVLRERLLQRGRKDDNVETINERFKTFVERSQPVIDHFRAQGKVRTVVQSEATETAEYVFESVLEAMMPEITLLLGGSCGNNNTKVIDVPALLKETAKQGSPIGQRIREVISRGQLVPTETIIELLETKLIKNSRPDDRFTLIGFPRTIEQCAQFEKRIVPAKYVVQIGELKPKASPLSDYMKSVGRLVEIPSVSEFEHSFPPKQSYILASNSFDFPPHVNVVDLENIAMAKPRGPLVIRGLPQSLQQAQDLYETIGHGAHPDFVLAHHSEQQDNPVVDQLAFEGKLRTFSEKLFDQEIVTIVGDGAFAQQGKYAQQYANEFGFLVLDVANALASLKTCPSTWEAEIIVNFTEKDRQVKEFEATSDSAVLGAKKRLVIRALNSSCKRGVVLYNCDGEKELIQALKPQRVLFMGCNDTFATENLTRQLKAQQEEGEDEVDPEVVEKCVQEFAVEQAAKRDFIGTLSTNCSTIDASGDDVVQQLRQTAQVELFLLNGQQNNRELARSLCTNFAKRFNIVYIPVRKLLEREMQAKSKSGLAIAKALKSGTSVPLEVSIPLLRSEISNAVANGAKRFILTGFPTMGSVGFPFPHDQLFALEKAVGQVKLCFNLVADHDEQLDEVSALFKSLNKYAEVNLQVDQGELVEGACAAISLLHKNEEQRRRVESWVPGDGSPQALLQDVFDRYKPNRSASRTAEEYFAQFNVLEDGNVPLAEITEKMQSWELENNPADYFTTSEFVSKHEWYEYVFKVLLLLDEASNIPEPEQKEPVEEDQQEE